ncbi:ABC transporter permease [Spirochaeta lutea]|uniref:ABC transporter permease n=2 Tax=Spirochaeta lutea TaxID=1480694 RepID=A0A098QTW0_9SPIO|nr:ABC transporter permease [Spirochaeta lutea]
MRTPLVSYAVLGIWSILVLVPLWVMVINSFKPRLSIYASPLGFPEEWTLEGYRLIFTGSSFPLYFLNSLLVVGVSIVFILVCAAAAAYAIANWQVTLTRVVALFFLAGLMIPIRIGSVNLLQIAKALNLLDKAVGLIPVYVAMGMPLGVFVLTEFVRGVPRDLLHAAQIDGASRARIFWQIILPLTRPAMATVAIFNLVNLWNDLWFPLIFIRSENQRTLMLGITRLFGQYQTDWTRILSTLTLASVPIILLYLLMAKQFIRGLTAGAIKG